MPNRLALETSPYLRQHANNPVDWYPWGAEALALASQSGRPILLSIGYAACHWCHVMAHESFEDPAIATVMNQHFVNIKVDREERPDLDEIYMQATQAMTGHGGWPMTVFLTPEGKPFFAGTYFPNVDRHGLPSFTRVLRGVAEAWEQRKEDVELQAERLVEVLNPPVPPSATPDPGALRRAYQQVMAGADHLHGGFGPAPKFPQTPLLEFLLRVAEEPWASEAKVVLIHALSAMADGGIYDQLGGGFSRYATDAHWLVPHFEKMLYDNASLARLYLRAWQVTGVGRYRQVAVETVDYLLRDMSVEGGGLASSEDADSEGEEGKFYVWTRSEFDEVAGDDAEVAAAVFGVTAVGNFEGANVLSRVEPETEMATRLGIQISEVEARLQAARRKLFEARTLRVRPARDDKVICAWNGLGLRALAEVGAVLEVPTYLEAGRRLARFVLTNLRREDGRLLRSWLGKPSPVPAFLDDHAALAVGLFALFQATGEVEWYQEAMALTDSLWDLFWDEGFSANGRDSEQLVAKPADSFDNPTSSGASLAVEALFLAAHYVGEARYFERLEQAIAAGGWLVQTHPTAVGHLLAVMHSANSTPRELAVVGTPNRELVAVAWERFRPNLVIATDPGDGSVAAAVPLLRGRTPHGGPALAYLCERFVCQLPVSDPGALRSQLDS